MCSDLFFPGYAGNEFPPSLERAFRKKGIYILEVIRKTYFRKGW